MSYRVLFSPDNYFCMKYGLFWLLLSPDGGVTMNYKKILAVLFALAAFSGTGSAFAQTPYGMPITLDQAKKAMTAAEAEAKKNNWNMVIAIVDAGGHLMLLERLDNTQFGSVDIAREKAHAAAAFRRPTKAWQDLIAQGGVHLRLLNLTGDAGVLEGAVPIIVDGKVIGGIGASGGSSQQDAQVSQAGADALK
jgi:glc operon protein GlcG